MSERSRDEQIWLLISWAALTIITLLSGVGIYETWKVMVDHHSGSVGMEVLPEHPMVVIPFKPTPTAEAKTPTDSLTLDEVWEVLNNDRETDLQQEDFLKQMIGKEVEWEGIVVQIRRSTYIKDQTWVHLHAPDMLFHDFVAWFGKEHEKELLSFYKGDLVRVRGIYQGVRIILPKLDPCSSITLVKEAK